MLYGNESISHYTRGNISIWMTLAFQAGLLNIGGFMACHRFVSHITGFATHFGHELVQADSSQALGMLVVPVFFLIGAMISGQLVDIRLKLHKNPRYYFTFGIIFFLICSVYVLGILGYFGGFSESMELSKNYILLVLLCLTCGIQNGTITTVSKSIVRTTHLTGITTDLGIGIVRLLNRKNLGEEVTNESSANMMRFGIILFFIIGSAFGGLVFNKFGYGGFVVPAITSGILFALMLYFQVLKNIKLNLGET